MCSFFDCSFFISCSTRLDVPLEALVTETSKTSISLFWADPSEEFADHVAKWVVEYYCLGDARIKKVVWFGVGAYLTNEDLGGAFFS
jgi:hypothetical protein